MSFIYAFKFDDSIYMIGDTKVTIDDSRGVENFKDKRKLIEEYGILKTIILSPDIALAFAGNDLGHVNDALKEIYESASQQKNIVDILRDFSRKEKDAPDFILAYKNELIYLITRGNVEERENCYIGSPAIFSELQRRRNNQSIKPNIILPLVRSLIKDNIDKEVGGFSIALNYHPFEKRYIYHNMLDSTVLRERYIPSGATLPLVDTAEDGGFTYITFPIYNEGAIQYLAFQLTQINKTYAYIPMMNAPPCDCIYKHLFLPFNISDRV